jgi:hypothetical protein
MVYHPREKEILLDLANVEPKLGTSVSLKSIKAGRRRNYGCFYQWP